MDPTRERPAKEGELFHRAARCDGHRRTSNPCDLFRNHDRPALDWARGRREMGMPVQLTPAHQLRKGCGSVKSSLRSQTVLAVAVRGSRNYDNLLSHMRQKVALRFSCPWVTLPPCSQRLKNS